MSDRHASRSDDAARAADAGRNIAAADVRLAATIFAVDPQAAGGVAVKAAHGPVRDAWMTAVRALLPAAAPMHTLPLHITEDRLLGGLDLDATLRLGRRVVEPGVLARADGGVVVLAMAERWSRGCAAHVAQALDQGVVAVARDGVENCSAARFGVIALDESLDDEPPPPAALLDRLAFQIDLTRIALRDLEPVDLDRDAIVAARHRLADVPPPDRDAVQAICATAVALGIGSLRAPSLALHAARVLAALDGRTAIDDADITTAARLVFAPRATTLPQTDDTSNPPEAPPPDDPDTDTDNKPDPDQQRDDQQQPSLDDLVLAAARAAIPPGLLATLQLAAKKRPGASPPGQSGAARASATRGRRIGVRPADDRRAARIDILATLRAAAPWQKLRRAASAAHIVPDARAKTILRRTDLRIRRYRERTGTTIIFAVDASGSSALNRLAEAKGAVELLLAESYARRDRVALVSFRGTGAEILLPPSRALAQAKRSLAGLPGGGGTPLAAGIEAAAGLADAALRRGDTPLIVLLTDGRANVGRDGTGGRATAEVEALDAARAVFSAGTACVLVDTSPRPNPMAERIAAAMGGRYLPLPLADAQAISTAVRHVASGG